MLKTCEWTEMPAHPIIKLAAASLWERGALLELDTMFVPVVISKKPLTIELIILLSMPRGLAKNAKILVMKLITPVSSRMLIITENNIINPPIHSSSITEFFIAFPKRIPKCFCDLFLL